jgi:hypothetical protein
MLNWLQHLIAEVTGAALPPDLVQMERLTRKIAGKRLQILSKDDLTEIVQIAHRTLIK